MVFRENDSGDVIGIGDDQDPNPFSDTPVFTYCIAGDCEITGSQNTSRRPATGRAHRKIVADDYDYSGNVSNLYLKLDELDTANVFARDQYLALYFVFLSYMRNPATQKEWHALRRTKVASFSISSKENGLANCKASFLAEEYYNG